jgi:D-lactate dehydrogenase
MITVAVYDTKPYDREFLQKTAGTAEIQWRFLDFRLMAETALTAEGSDAVCVFVHDQLDRRCLEALAKQGVKLVVLRCAGFNNVDIAAARELNIAVTRAAEYSPNAVAEHAVALLLTLNRKIHRAYNRVRDQNFSLTGLVGFDLYGKTAGILGTGRIGRIAAEILKGFGMRVLAYDLFPQADWAKSHDVEYVDIDVLARESDVLSLHLPLSPKTKFIIHRGTLDLMKPGAILINVSRGKLVDTAALIEALKSGKLGGVALDVYEEEEGIFYEDLSGLILQDDELARLLSFPNVLITSHQAFLTSEALSDISRVTVENIMALAEGRPFAKGTVLEGS